ncbi:MAG TPA: nickel pincer cofactor biosynthesis protein LarC [Ktedonobacterales bacterium]|nr:nickel pincer cofactor biosynthesis protein LarC [Ktedonobacterales bacterium]
MLAYVDCFSGVSGDMLLGALLHAGAALDDLRVGLARLPLTGYMLEADDINDHGIRGVRAHVRMDDTEQAHRRLADVEAIITAAGLPERASERALVIFRRLAAAEGVVHGIAPEAVSFHEVGAVDSIVDTVGVALGLELLGIDDLYCSELPLTSGRVRSAHGPLPVPAPATLELLKGTGATWRPVDAEGELVTPTGAAVVAALARFERPAMSVEATGYGFGTRTLPWANCVRLMIGTAHASAPSAIRTPEGAAEREGFIRDTVVVIESNIDNMTGETLGWLLERLLAEGALDVSYAPLQMKKHRPGALLTVIVAPNDAERLAGLILRESATLGVRLRTSERLIAGRRIEQIETPLGLVRVKLKLAGEQVMAIAPEYDDLRELAAQVGLPLETVAAQVTQAARRHFGLDV